MSTEPEDVRVLTPADLDEAEQMPIEDDFDTALATIDPEHGPKRAFLIALRFTGSANKACRAARVAKSTYKYWLSHDDNFSACCKLAREEAADMLVQEARRRAIYGVERVRPIFYQGEQVGAEVWKEYSDKLLQFLIETEAGANLDVIYRKKKEVEHTGRVDHFMRLAEAAEVDQQEWEKQLEAGKDGQQGDVDSQEVIDAEVREL